MYVVCRYLVEFVLPGDVLLPRDDISLDSGFSDDDVEVTEEGTALVMHQCFLETVFLNSSHAVRVSHRKLRQGRAQYVISRRFHVCGSIGSHIKFALSSLFHVGFTYVVPIDSHFKFALST